MSSVCSDMSPYNGKDYEDAVGRLLEHPFEIDRFVEILFRHWASESAEVVEKVKQKVKETLSETHSYTDFQKMITCGIFLDAVEKSSIDKLEYSGLEELDDRPHIYISNHRDIILDTALLDYVLNKNNRQMCEMVVGDNLLSDNFSNDMFRMNGAVVLRRFSSGASELKQSSMNLSSYIHDCVYNRKKSVWIAQRSGRAKDGCDNTSPSVLKMLYLSNRSKGLSFSEFLDMVSIVPVAISYQYDPCAVNKSFQERRRLKSSENGYQYKKKKFEDTIDIVRGLRLYKGNVHIHFGTEINGSVDNVQDAVCAIDSQIHSDYRLYDTNWFCYDILKNTKEHCLYYDDFDGKSFLSKLSIYGDDILKGVLNQYANPVGAYLNEKNT